jgi:hypothetical protein
MPISRQHGTRIMIVDVRDPSIRREIEARLEREGEREPDRPHNQIRMIAGLLAHLLHVIWLLGRMSG